MIKVLFWPLVIIFSIFGFLYVQGRLDQISFAISQKMGIAIPAPVDKNTCGDDCKRIIVQEVAKAIATISGQPKATTPPSTQSLIVPPTTYISLGQTASTTSTDWVDVPANEVAFDVTSDYGKNAKIAWEASLRVANSNGQAYARLFDVTHQIAVSGSEISTTNNADYQRVNSGNLNLWAGRNTYRVQIKSLNSFNVDFTGGRIRISY